MAKTKPTIAITGAGGFLGSSLVSYFDKKGWQVLAFVRNPATHASTANVTYIKYDLKSAINKAVFHGVDYLVHTAYQQYDDQHINAFDVNVFGAKQLLPVARQIKKAVFISSMSAHDDAVSVYGKQKLAVEKIFARVPNAIVLRPGLIVGNGGLVKRTADFIKTKHVVPMIDQGNQPLQIVGIDDLVKVIDKVLSSSSKGTFIIAHPRVYTYKHFYKAVSKQLRIKAVFIPVPFFVLMAMIRLAAILHIPLGINKDNLLGLKKLKSIDNSRDLKHLGVRLSPLEQVVKKLKV